MQKINLNLNAPLSKESLEFLKQLSVRAYSNLESINSYISDLDTNAIFLEDAPSDGQAYIVRAKEFTLVAFRGTESRIDIRSDLKAWPTKTPYGRVHSGFYAAFLRLWPLIWPHIDGNKPLVITGHSLGGALAQLCAVWCCRELKIPPLFVVTFAQPRVGAFKFASYTDKDLHGRYFRIVKILDFVPRVPPYWIGYIHPASTDYRKNKNGEATRLKFFERHIWSILGACFLLAALTLAYLVFISHGIGGY